MKKITFWKDNLISGEHNVSVEKIIKDFNKTKDSTIDQPFERLILTFMAIKYGSFNDINEGQWDALHSERVKQRKNN